jgi:Protein of unknown function (DUF2971)
MGKIPQEYLKQLEEKGFVIGPAIGLNELESELIGKAVYVHPNQPLLHYMRAEHFLALLDTEKFHMARIDQYPDDPQEGRYPTANSQEQSELSNKFANEFGIVTDLQAMITSNEIHRQHIYVHCWFGLNIESPEMWEKYGEKGKGVCLKTTASRLLNAVKPPSDLHFDIHGVTYSDEDKPIPHEISFLPFCRKRRRFKSENEFRMLATIRQESLPLDSNGYILPTPNFRKIPVNLNDLLEAVFIGAFAESGFIEQVNAAFTNKLSLKIIQKSEIFPKVSQ